MKTLTVKVTVEIPEEIQERLERASKIVGINSYVQNYGDVKEQIVKVLTAVAESFGG